MKRIMPCSMENVLKTDILVIGSGIAGLGFALKAAKLYPEKKILVVSKGSPENCNTRFAQGGIAGVFDEKDSKDLHINDTLSAGDYYNLKESVQVLVEEAPERIRDLIELGVNFDKDGAGNYHLALEGGHSARRIFHYKDATGWEILKILIDTCHKTKNIHFLTDTLVAELMVGYRLKECTGALLFSLKGREVVKVLSKVTVLATGGAGQVYLNTTNPEGACGDGIALANRIGAEVENMEFIQFHPTAFYKPSESPSFLISEAVRGAGAVLRNHKNEDFVKKYDERGSLAPRDVVSRAIFYEMQEEYSDNVFLDCTQIPFEDFKCHFPNIYQKCKAEGIDIRKDYIPVSPAAHYTCGGIKTDLFGRTSLKRLYAIGECSSTGVHGANRLASNSLSEALVFSNRAAIVCSAEFNRVTVKSAEVEYCFSYKADDFSALKKSIKTIMWEKAGIVKNTEDLELALENLALILEILKRRPSLSLEYIEVKSLAEVAILIVKASLKRKENKGGFFNSDLVRVLEKVN